MSTPTQLVTRLRDVFEVMAAAMREGQPPLRTDVEAFAATAQSVAEGLAALADDAGSAEMVTAALAIQALAAATVLAWNDPNGALRAGVYGGATGALLTVLSTMADVPFTIYANEGADPGAAQN